jgi:cell division protein FtsZ
LASKNAKLIDMFKKADEILLNSVKGITDLIFMPGYVNLDFADVRNTMSKSGMALMGIGIASGENRAIEAAERAIQHPLLEDMSISGAKGVLMNITSTREITLDEMTEASDRIHKEVGDDAEIIWGQIFDDTLGDEMRVTVIATGIGSGVEMLAGRRKLTALRGRLRDITPADMDNIIDYEEPTFKRKQNKVEEAAIPEDESAFKLNPQDEYDLDVPTFLRRKAD